MLSKINYSSASPLDPWAGARPVTVGLGCLLGWLERGNINNMLLRGVKMNTFKTIIAGQPYGQIEIFCQR